jgi:hypothetical protein
MNATERYSERLRCIWRLAFFCCWNRIVDCCDLVAREACFFSIFDTRSFFSLITSFFLERLAVVCGDCATARCRDLHSVAIRCDDVGLDCGVCACWEWADIYRVYEEGLGIHLGGLFGICISILSLSISSSSSQEPVFASLVVLVS